MSNSFSFFGRERKKKHVAYINFDIFTLRRNRRQSLLHVLTACFLDFIHHIKLSKQSYFFFFRFLSLGYHIQTIKA